MLRKSDYHHAILAGLILLAVVLCSTASGGLVGHWKFDETSGNTARDSSGNGNNGTVVGTATWAQGYIDGAFEFDGSTYINCGNTPSLNVRDEITMLFWFKVDAFQNTWEAFLSKGDGAYRASRGGGDGNGTHMGISGSNYFNAPTIITDNQWHHYAGIYDGTTASIYVDGVLDASQTYSGQIGDSSGYNLYIGENSQATGRLLHGLMDDVRIYDRALTDDQLVDLVVNGIEPAWLKAVEPNPADGAIGVTMPLLQWSPGDKAMFHNVYLGTSPDLTAADQVGVRLPFTMHYHVAGFVSGTTYYWRVDEVQADGVTTNEGDVWTFTSAPTTAYSPNPRSGDKWIDPAIVLTWQPGQGATKHEVYFGTDKDAVAARDASVFIGSQLVSTYEPGPLEQETTYYWIVDELNGAKYEGELWSFTTVGAGAGGVKAEYFNGMIPQGAPALTRIDPSIDFSWGDPGGPGAPIGVDQFSARWTADLEIAIADTYTFITSSDDGVRLWLNGELIIDQWVDQGTTDVFSTPIALEPGIYSLQLDYYENGGGAVARLSWQTPNVARQIIPAGPLQPPLRAKALYPVNDAVDVPQDVTLMWSAGENAATHDVYFGDDEAAVAAATPASTGIYRGSQMLDQTTFAPGVLEWNKTYYWRIDEGNVADADSPWESSVWSFTTADFIVVDDLESYTDAVTGRIFQTWIDGWGYTEPAPGDPGNGTGATIGYLDPPFAEQSIVHSGRQAMPFDYNNIIPPYYSETERTWATPQDWTAGGVTDLSLWVRGYQAAATVNETAPGAFSVTGEGADIWGSSDQFTYVYKTLNADGSLVARVVSNGEGSNEWAKGGVMIRDTLAAGSTHATQIISAGGGNGASFQYRPVADDASSNSDVVDPVEPPYWVKIERLGNSLSGYLSPNGATWTQLGTSQVIFMTNPVYIGLCVTSHAAGENRTFEFDNVTATGAPGQWQVREIGLTRNDPATLYVAIQDSTGTIKTVPNPEPGAVNATDWTEWKIPLTEFAGVSLNRVKKMFIGVGDRDFPTPDGHGMLFIDDIRVVKPAPPEPVVE